MFRQHLDGVQGIEPAKPKLRFVPGVFAYGDPQGFLLQRHHPHLGGRIEVAAFIEDVVGGQQRFVLLKQDLAAADQHRGVAQPLAGIPAAGQRRAHQQGGPGVARRGCRQPGQRLLHLPDQGGVLQQVPGRVAHQEQLREDDEVGGAAVLIQGLHGFPEIAGDVPHGGI